MSDPLSRLRRHAVGATLFRPRSLKSAVERLGFVQADPIRAPARAQDLILRHRVTGYRAGDLERLYPSLNLEEDFLYAYGFMTQSVCDIVHPRPTPRLTKLEANVLARVRDAGSVHPRALDEHFGRERVLNAWGGFSQSTKRVLERLHYYGLIRVVRREAGVRIYEVCERSLNVSAPAERFKELLLILVTALQPIPERSLYKMAARFRESMRADHRKALQALVASGELERHVVGDVAYVWPAGRHAYAEPPPVVRFLAPFDPLVWDRFRFEHLWQWPYRFEAYTPAAKRVRGYYALPLLWRDDVVGWANASVRNSRLTVDLGFVLERPKSRAFKKALSDEIEQMQAFLGL